MLRAAEVNSSNRGHLLQSAQQGVSSWLLSHNDCLLPFLLLLWRLALLLLLRLRQGVCSITALHASCIRGCRFRSSCCTVDKLAPAAGLGTVQCRRCTPEVSSNKSSGKATGCGAVNGISNSLDVDDIVGVAIVTSGCSVRPGTRSSQGKATVTEERTLQPARFRTSLKEHSTH